MKRTNVFNGFSEGNGAARQRVMEDAQALAQALAQLVAQAQHQLKLAQLML